MSCDIVQKLADLFLSLERVRQTWQRRVNSAAHNLIGNSQKLCQCLSKYDTQKSIEFATLTDKVHQGWSGGREAQHKDLISLDSVIIIVPSRRLAKQSFVAESGQPGVAVRSREMSPKLLASVW